jgi:hypothetical protein
MNSSTESKQTTHPKNYYFIEEEISPKILEFQKVHIRISELSEEIKSDENNSLKIDELRIAEKRRKILLEEIMDSTCKVIKGVIFRARFHKKEKFDMCRQIAVEACIKALPRFNPEHGTAFNYLSLTAKRSIIYYLIKRAKKKTLSLDFEYIDDEKLKLGNLVKQEEKIIRNLEIDNFIDTLYNLLDEAGEHKNLIKVIVELKDYLFYTQGKYDKKDFFKWAKSDGISSNILRKFIKFLKVHRERLYQEVGVY